MDKPIKPTNLMPREFGGIKNNFSSSLQSSGYEPNVPAIYGGDNLNYQLDATGKELDYCETICDFINAMPIGKGITVDANNKLVYADFDTDITGKANISLDNLNSDGKAKIAVKQYLVTETYALGDVVMAIIDDEVKLYKSLVANNIGNALTDTTKWEEVQLGGSTRNIGEIVSSTTPLTDAGLHLLDGALLQYGSYQAFIDYIADLYSVTEETWEQPILTSNTSYGTVSSTDAHNEHPPYSAFNGNKSGDDKYLSTSTSGGNITWSLPKQIKMSSCKIFQTQEAGYLDRFPTTITLQGSNDGSTWNTIGSLDNYSQPTSGSYVEVTVTTPTYYSYYKWLFGANFGGNSGVAISEIEINAIYQATPAYFTTEAEWQTSVTTYGVCGKFVYDSVNNTVRLPKITGFTEATIDTTTLGDLTEAGLPNIIGTIDGFESYNNTTGCFSLSSASSGWNISGASDANRRYLQMDASSSSSVYGNSNTVQPQAIKVLYYIVVATSTKTQIQVDIDEIATDLNGKADVDLTNVNNAGTSKGAGWPMSSETHVDLTLGASGSTYTAPATGWVQLTQNITNGVSYISIVHPNSDGLCAKCTNWSSNAHVMDVCLPVSKGETFKVGYSGASTPTSADRFQFIYAKGSESEA